MKKLNLKKIDLKKIDIENIHISKKVATRTAIGALSAVIIATGAWAFNASAGKDKDGTSSTSQDKVDKIESDDLKASLEKNVTISTVDADKEEMVYIISDAKGDVSSVIVSEHLKNKDGKDKIKDVSSLSDIKNVKGDETFTQDGDSLTWDAKGSEIYYQGTTDAELPISQAVTYYLDGKEIEPDKLAGKDGHVTIRFDYENKAKEGEVYVPFVAFTGMILDDNFSNIEVSNGKAIQDGNTSIIVGYAVPGIKDSLNAPGLNIPDYFEVSADVKDFELEATMTVVTNLGSLSFGDGSIDFSSIEDTITSVITGIDELSDGAAVLAEGTDTLKDGFKDYSDGVTSLTDGVSQYLDGSVSVNAGIKQVKDGIDTVSANMPAFQSGVTNLMNGANDAYEGSVKLKDGMKELHDGINKMCNSVEDIAGNIDDAKQDVYDSFKSKTGMTYDEASSKLQQLKTQRSQVVAACKGGMGMWSSLEEIDSGIASLEKGLGQVDGAIAALDGMKSKVSGSDTADGIAALRTGAGKVETGAIGLSEGLWKLYDGTRVLNDGTTTLVDGVSQLADGANTLYDGSNTLIANNQTILDGSSRLYDATIQLTNGIDELSEGAHKLDDGVKEFKEEGISEVMDGYVTDAEDLVDRIDAIKTAAENYQSYAGIAEGQQGTVKFIFRTDGIK